MSNNIKKTIMALLISLGIVFGVPLFMKDRQEAHAATTVFLNLAIWVWLVVIFYKWYVRKKKQIMSAQKSEKASPNSQPQKDSGCAYCGEMSPATAENCVNCNRPL